MALSFLSYRVDRRFPLFYSILPSILLHPFFHMHCISLLLLFYFLLLCLSNSTPSYIFHTICYIGAPCLGTPAPYFPRFLFPCSYIPYILQESPPPISLSTPPYSSLLLLEAILLPHSVLSSSPIPS